jgi:nicotinamide riboside transporter PnuC
MLEYLAWLATALGMIGGFLNAKKKRCCFYLWIGSNIVFMALSVMGEQWPQASMFSYYLATCFIGLHSWKKEGK